MIHPVVIAKHDTSYYRSEICIYHVSWAEEIEIARCLTFFSRRQPISGAEIPIGSIRLYEATHGFGDRNSVVDVNISHIGGKGNSGCEWRPDIDIKYKDKYVVSV